MLKNCAAPLTFLIAMAVFWSGCSKETEELRVTPVHEYYPLEVGKYMTYRLDSTVYVNLNTVKEVHTYIIQDFVDSMITDNLGRPSYRIRRMIRSNDDTTVWTDNATFIVTPLDKSIELIENNLRYIKLKAPVTEGYTWRGNSYINSYSNPDLQYLDNWEYYYENVDQPYSGTVPYAETITIQQRDEVLGNPNNKAFYFEINQGREIYAKGIGLVYRHFLHEAWQSPNITSPAGYYEPNSYGVTLTLLNHN